MKNKLYRSVPVSERLPHPLNQYLTDVGMCFLHKEGGWTNGHDNEQANPSYWLEEVELPSDEEIVSRASLQRSQDRQDGFCFGANFILNHIKGGGV